MVRYNDTLQPVNFRNFDGSLKEHHLDKTDACAMISSPRKIRPKSCVAYANYDDKSNSAHKPDVETVKKSNPICSIVFRALDKLTSEDSEDYTDSLEHSPLNRASNKHPVSTKSQAADNKTDDEDNMSGEAKFRKLQEKWELMVGKEDAKNQPVMSSPLSPTRTPTSLGKSKIPRLLASPVKQLNAASGSAKNTKSPVSGIPSLKKPAMLSTTKSAPKKPVELRGKEVTKRTSRVDQEIVGTRTHLTRPSSLPYKPYGVMSKDKNLVSPQRRAASTSLPRPTTTTTTTTTTRNPTSKKPLK